MTPLPGPRPIKLMADYGCHPLWWDSTHPLWRAWGEPVGDIDPGSLGISEALRADLLAWAERFDARLNWSSPADTVVSPEDDIAFEAAGRDLARRLSQELGAAGAVRYWRDPPA